MSNAYKPLQSKLFIYVKAEKCLSKEFNMVQNMRVAFIIFDNMTSLDFIGVYDPITRLKTMGFLNDLEWDICAVKEIITDYTSLRLMASKVKPDLGGYDILIIPGGFGTRKLIHDKSFIAWIKTAESCQLKASVCTGSLLLGAAGFLEGKRATTHPKAFTELSKFCKSVIKKRIVDEGDVITAGGVTASIDLGLYLCKKLSSPEVAQKIQQQMDYKTVLLP